MLDQSSKDVKMSATDSTYLPWGSALASASGCDMGTGPGPEHDKYHLPILINSWYSLLQNFPYLKQGNRF